MVFVHGFLHVDLHPGNILVSSEGQSDFSLGMQFLLGMKMKTTFSFSPQVACQRCLLCYFHAVLLDFGICKELDEVFRLNYCKLWKALTFMDSRNIKLLSDEMGVGKYYRFFPVIFMGRTINRWLSVAFLLFRKRIGPSDLGYWFLWYFSQKLVMTMTWKWPLAWIYSHRIIRTHLLRLDKIRHDPKTFTAKFSPKTTVHFITSTQDSRSLA